MACDCPKTDGEIAAAVMAGEGDELLVCDDAYEKLLQLTFGAAANATTTPSFQTHRGNPFATSSPVPVVTIRAGKKH